MIYLCGECDFIGSTAASFNDHLISKCIHACLSKYLDGGEGDEYSIGTNAIVCFENFSSEPIIWHTYCVKTHRQRERGYGRGASDIVHCRTLANNEMPLYIHPTRCPTVMQHLDNNPNYWCFVPMSHDAAREDDRATSTRAPPSKTVNRCKEIRSQPPESPSYVKKPRFFEEVLRNTTRTVEECVWLACGLPDPPYGYRFSDQQIEDQLSFFKYKKEAHVSRSNWIDCHQYTIIAVCKCVCVLDLLSWI